MQSLLRKLHERLQELRPAHLKVVVGFDGFVDEIVEAVDRRHSFASYTRMSNMTQFGERISKAAGLSTNIELVPKTMKLGGNGPIMANALVAGHQCFLYGRPGQPNVHPVFNELVEGCTEVYSLLNLATDAVEFEIAAVMLGKMEGLNDILGCPKRWWAQTSSKRRLAIAI